MNYKLLTIAVYLIITTGFQCNAQNDIITISGTIQLNKNIEKVTLVDIGNKNAIVDTCLLLENGAFELSYKVNQLVFLKLMLDKRYQIQLVSFPGENISIEAIGYFYRGAPKISGSPHSALLAEVSWGLRDYNSPLINLGREYNDIVSDSTKVKRVEVIKKQMDSIQALKEKYIKQIVEANPSSPACLFFANNLPMADYLPTFILLNNKLFSLYPENQYVRELNYAVRKERFLVPGREAQEIVLPDMEGNKIALSSLKGKVVLVDFWASWCGPCKKELPTVIEAYNKFKNKGFEIYAVSLDTHKNYLLKAIEKYGLEWINVSDFKKWDSEVAIDWAVRSIPFNVLIDEKGIIIATNLRGSALENELSKLFENR